MTKSAVEQVAGNTETVTIRGSVFVASTAALNEEQRNHLIEFQSTDDVLRIAKANFVDPDLLDTRSHAILQIKIGGMALRFNPNEGVELDNVTPDEREKVRRIFGRLTGLYLARSHKRIDTL